MDIVFKETVVVKVVSTVLFPLRLVMILTSGVSNDNT